MCADEPPHTPWLTLTHCSFLLARCDHILSRGREDERVHCIRRHRGQVGEGGWKEQWWDDPEGYKVEQGELVTSVKSGKEALWSNYSRNHITRECSQRSRKCLRIKLLKTHFRDVCTQEHRALKRRVAIFSRVYNSQGQLNASVICHWQKPLHTIITTVSVLKTHSSLLTSTFLCRLCRF